jgi:hypothetical protein
MMNVDTDALAPMGNEPTTPADSVPPNANASATRARTSTPVAAVPPFAPCLQRLPREVKLAIVLIGKKIGGDDMLRLFTALDADFRSLACPLLWEVRLGTA